MPHYLTSRAAGAVPILPLAEGELEPWLKSQPPAVTAWVESLRFTAKAGSHCLLPGDDGALARVLLGIDPADGPYAFAGLPAALPLGRYRLEASGAGNERERANQAALGWALGSYAFGRFRKARDFASLAWPKGADRGAVARTAPTATAFGRRTAPYLLSYDSCWIDPALGDAVIAWTKAQIDFAAGHSPGGSYLNFPGVGAVDLEAVKAAYGENYDRLRRIKARYDPHNMFRLNQNIPPATDADAH